MNTEETFWNTFLDIWMDMAPYMLLGLLIAFACTYFMTEKRMHRHLGGSSLLSIIKASLIGIPIPFCSCGVLPVALALRKSGASTSTTMAFLAATPQSGTDALPLTCSLFSIPFACLRFVSAFLSGVVCGCITHITTRKKDSQKPSQDLEGKCAAICCCHHHTETETHDEEEMHHHEYVSRHQRLKDAAAYAFIHLPREIAGFLIIGVLASVFICHYVPMAWLEHMPIALGYVVAIGIGIPMYACSIALVPIAYTLVEAGLSLGAAFILLITAPTMSVASLMIICRSFGLKIMTRYIMSICAVSILLAAGLDLTPRSWWMRVGQDTTIQQCGSCDHETHDENAPTSPVHSHNSPIHIISTIGFTVILVGSQFCRRKKSC